MPAWVWIASCRSAASVFGLHARWHGIIAASGIADFFTISVGLALD